MIGLAPLEATARPIWPLRPLRGGMSRRSGAEHIVNISRFGNGVLTAIVQGRGMKHIPPATAPEISRYSNACLLLWREAKLGVVVQHGRINGLTLDDERMLDCEWIAAMVTPHLAKIAAPTGRVPPALN